MHISSIKLRDWKAFESAAFEFPQPGSRKNVVLIGGRNGYGKTTLFEALALGLFGRDGLALVLRAGVAADEQRLSQNFRSFIERALFTGALPSGRNSCSIELRFIDESGEPIEIVRRWHFNDAGKLKQGEYGEELRIIEGTARRPVMPPRSEADPDSWYRNWISRRFLPTSLAGFFLFDGESASIYAERDMGAQVREGISGLLGLNWLEQLARDLRQYAASKRTQLPRGASTEAINQLEAAIAAMEAELANAGRRCQELELELRGSEQERDALTRELAGFGGGTRAQFEELAKEKADHERQYENAEDRLRIIAEMDLPLALTGQALRHRVSDRLDRERHREQWEAATSQRQERTSQVVALLDEQLSGVAPPLIAEQEVSVRQAVQNALERLWFPPPENVADSFRHPHARGPLLQRVLDRLTSAQAISSGTVVELLDAIDKTAAKMREIQAAIRQTEGEAPQTDDKRTRLAELNTRIGELNRESGELGNLRRSRTDEIQQKRGELGRLTGQMDQSQKPARLASRAEQVANMLDQLVQEAWPTQTQHVASEMTEAVRSMAHRNDYLNRVEIDAEGAVALRSPRGDDLRQLDLSAGEKQIFTQALFSAVAKVSEREFPLVVDTPLGRLDEQHRLNVLRHLASRSGQVILISTDTEVVGAYLDAIRSKVGKTYIIRNETHDGVARSRPEAGYFDGQDI